MKAQDIIVENIGEPSVYELATDERKRFYVAMLAAVLDRRRQQLSEGKPPEDQPQRRDHAVHKSEGLQ